jgi:hypothetical protein
MDIPLQNLKKRLQKVVSIFAMVTLLATSLPLNIYTALAQGAPPKYESVTVTQSAATDAMGPNMVLLMFDQVLDTENADASMFSIKDVSIQSISTDVWNNKGILLFTDVLVNKGDTVSVKDLPFLTTSNLLTKDVVVGDFSKLNTGDEKLQNVTFSGQDIVIKSENGGTFDSKSSINPLVHGDFGEGLVTYQGVVANTVISGDTVTLTPIADVSAMNLTICLDGLQLSNGTYLLDNCTDVNDGIDGGNEGGGGGGGNQEGITGFYYEVNTPLDYDPKTNKITIRYGIGINNTQNAEYLGFNYYFDDNGQGISSIDISDPKLIESNVLDINNTTVAQLGGPHSITFYQSGGIPSGEGYVDVSFIVDDGNFPDVYYGAFVFTDPNDVYSSIVGGTEYSSGGFGIGQNPQGGGGDPEVSDLSIAYFNAIDSNTVELSFNPTIEDPDNAGNLALQFSDSKNNVVTPSNVTLTDTNLDPLDGIAVVGDYIVLSRSSGMTSGGGYFTIRFDMSLTDGDNVNVFGVLVSDALDPDNSHNGSNVTSSGVIGSFGGQGGGGDEGADALSGATIGSFTTSSATLTFTLGDSGLPANHYIKYSFTSNAVSLVPADGTVSSVVATHAEGNSGSINFSNPDFYFSDGSDISAGMDLSFVADGGFSNAQEGSQVDMTAQLFGNGKDGIPGTGDDIAYGDAVSGSAVIAPDQVQKAVLNKMITSNVSEAIKATDVSQNELRASFSLADSASLENGRFRFYVMQQDLSAPYNITDATLVGTNLTCDESISAVVSDDNSYIDVSCPGTLEQANYTSGLSFSFSLTFGEGAPSPLDAVKVGVMALDSQKQQIGNTLITDDITVGSKGNLGVADEEGATPVSGTCDLDNANQPPFLLYTSPQHNVPVNAPIYLYFSECISLNENDIKLESGGQDIEFEVALDSQPDGESGETIAALAITPTSGLPANSPVVLYIKGAKDADNNPIPINGSVNIDGIDTQIFVMDMFTGVGADFTFDFGNPPWLEGTAPSLEEIIPRNSKLLLKFNEPIDSSVISTDNFVVYNFGTGQALTGDNYQVVQSQRDPSVIMIRPAVPKGSQDTPLWPANTELEVRIGGEVKSEFGFPLGGDGISVTYNINGATDDTAPTIKAALSGFAASEPATFTDGEINVAISAPILTLVPSEGIDPTTILNGITCSNNVDCAFEYNVEENLIQVYFENVTGSSPDDSFTITASGLQDLAGNTITERSASVTFTSATDDDVHVVDFFANPFEVMLKFDQLMNDSTLSLTNSVLNKANYSIKDSNGVTVSMDNVIIDYDRATSELYLRGLDLVDAGRVDVVLNSNILSKFGDNLLDNAVYKLGIESADSFGAHFDDEFDKNFWSTPVIVEPLNRLAGQTGVLHVEFTLGSGQTIEDGDQVIITMPAGFTTTGDLAEDPFSPFTSNKSFDDSKRLNFDSFSESDAIQNRGAQTADGVFANGGVIVVVLDTEDSFSEGDVIAFDLKGIKNSSVDGDYEFGLKVKTGNDNGDIVKYTLSPLGFDILGGDSYYKADVQVVGGSDLEGVTVNVVARTHAGDVPMSGVFDENGVADLDIIIPVAGEFEVFVADPTVGPNGEYRPPRQGLRMYIDDNFDELRTINLTKWGADEGNNNQEVTVTLNGFSGSETGVYEIFARSRDNFYGEKINLENDISNGVVTKTFYLPPGRDFQIGFEPAVLNDFGTSDTGKAQSFGDVYPSGPPVHLRTNTDGCFENSGTADDCAVEIPVLTNSISVSVKVVDENNAAMSGATVCMDNPENHVGLCETVGVNGTATVKVPVAGSYNSIAFKSGLPSKETSFFVNSNGTAQVAGNTVNQVTYRISKSNKTTVGFKVIDTDGNPSSDAFITCFGTDKPFFNDMQVDANGRATMWLQQDTSYTCEAHVDGFGIIADLDIDVQSLPLTNKIFRPENTFYTVSGTVSYGVKQGISNALVPSAGSAHTKAVSSGSPSSRVTVPVIVTSGDANVASTVIPCS